MLRLPLVFGPHDWQRREVPVGAANLLWTRGHVDDLATGVLAGLDTRAADGVAVNIGEPATRTLGWWLRRIVEAAGSGAELVRVPEHLLAPDLALTAASAKHLLVSVARAQVDHQHRSRTEARRRSGRPRRGGSGGSSAPGGDLNVGPQARRSGSAGDRCPRSGAARLAGR